MMAVNGKNGYTLTELMVVVAILAMLVGLGVPAAKQIVDSFESSAGLNPVISAALNNARAIATKKQRYAGVRFQQNIVGNQYMIFIVHDPVSTNLANGFREIEGLKPIKLPRNAGVMDLRIRTNRDEAMDSSDMSIEVFGDEPASNDNINETCEVTDTTTFSIVFSPAGKLVTHETRIRNDNNVFNTSDNVDNGSAMFVQDDDPTNGLGQEPSRKRFIIYDKRAFGAVDVDNRWTGYLRDREVLYVNPYTGEIINNSKIKN